MWGFSIVAQTQLILMRMQVQSLNLLSGLRIWHCHELQCGSLGQVELGTGRSGKWGWLFYPYTTIGIGGEEVIGTAAPDAGPRRQVMSFLALAGLGALGT